VGTSVSEAPQVAYVASCGCYVNTDNTTVMSERCKAAITEEWSRVFRVAGSLGVWTPET
jgi:hypothetical protein